MRRFQPVHLPEDRHLHGKASQTLLRHYNACPRSAYLYALNKGDASTPEMQRGSGLHAVIERATRAAIDQGEPFVPPEVVKAIVNEVLADPEFAIPVEEHDYLRESAYRWAGEWAVDPTAVVAAETLFVLRLGGYEVRCRIDFAELRERGAVVYVADFKSSRAAPSFEDVSRKRADGTLMAKNFQLVLYALVLAFGVPVRVEPLRWQLTPAHSWEAVPEPAVADPLYQKHQATVRFADGSEIPEPFPVAGRAQRFDLEFVFPGIEDRDGKMLRRPVTLTRLELEEYRASLEGLLARLAHSEESGDWPAVASTTACKECPASSLCPIPPELRDHRGEMNTAEQVAEALEKRHVEKKIDRAIQREIRAYVEARGPVLYGGGMVAEIGHRIAVEIRDKDGMFEAQDRAVRFGEPFDRSKFVKEKHSFPLVERELSADELAEEAIGGSDE